MTESLTAMWGSPLPAYPPGQGLCTLEMGLDFFQGKTSIRLCSDEFGVGTERAEDHHLELRCENRTNHMQISFLFSFATTSWFFLILSWHHQSLTVSSTNWPSFQCYWLCHFSFEKIVSHSRNTKNQVSTYPLRLEFAPSVKTLSRLIRPCLAVAVSGPNFLIQLSQSFAQHLICHA